MRFEVFPDAVGFLAKTDVFLLADEAVHNMVLSSASALLQNPEGDGLRAWLGAAFDDAGAPVAAGLWVPGRHMVISSSSPDDDVGSLFAHHARSALRDEAELKGLLAPDPMIDGFCERWTKLGGRQGQRGLDLLTMRLDLNPDLPLPVPIPSGRMRRAWFEDLKRLQFWSAAMAAEGDLLESASETDELARRSIESRRLFVWEDRGKPVSMAGYSGVTPAGVRLNSVYTPPEFRRKGYSRALTWQLGHWFRQTGKHFVCLFVDRKNTPAISLYTELGYREIAAVTEARFK